MTIWDKLEKQHNDTCERSMLSLFDDPNRFTEFSASLGDMTFDYSKTSLDKTSFNLLIDLLKSMDVESKRDEMFAGKKINNTEDRAVLHTALRHQTDTAVMYDGKDVMPEIRRSLSDMTAFSDAIRNGDITSSIGEVFTDIVNIGIGGSDLGPVMATRALAPYHDGPKVHFISNADGADIYDTLQNLNPHTTLIIIASKTFTTIETMTNARAARAWLLSQVSAENLGDHFAAVSTALEKTAEFDISADRVFGFEDWIGGRYSMWGPIGLSLMIAIGSNNFTDLLSGGFEMDEHFRKTPIEKNLPMLLAMVGIWNNDICNYPTRAVLPYDQRLLRLPAYLQQLDMESNGKSVQKNGLPVERRTGPVVWGEPGTNGQHAFYQLIHQGTEIVPCEFLVAAVGHEPDLVNQHNLLLANCFAQAEALLIGRNIKEVKQRAKDKGMLIDNVLAAQKVFSGNRPSTMLIYKLLDPKTLGKIIALYEHRVFVEGVVWNINSFDQWGVELGKELATDLLPMVENPVQAKAKDGSTQGLLNLLQKLRNS